MIEQNGRVVARDGDYAWVEGERTSSCGSCTAKGCGTGALSSLFGRRTLRIRVKNPTSEPVGAHVVLGLNEGAFLRGSFSLYLVPLLLMMIGAGVGELLAPQLGMQSSEVPALLLGLTGLAAGFAWVRFALRAAQNRGYFEAVILRRQEPVEIISVNTDSIK